MKPPTHIKFVIKTCIVTPSLVKENDLDWILGSWVYETRIDEIEGLGDMERPIYQILWTD